MTQCINSDNKLELTNKEKIIGADSSTDKGKYKPDFKKIRINGISSKGEANTAKEMDESIVINKCINIPTKVDVKDIGDKSKKLIDDQVKKMDKLKNPSLINKVISKIIYNKNDPRPNYIKPKGKAAKGIIGSLCGIFFIFIMWKFFKPPLWPQYLATFIFLFKRMFTFIIIVTLIIFTWGIIIKCLPKVFKLFLRNVIFSINPLKNPRTDERHQTLKGWKYIPNVFLLGAKAFYACLAIYFFFLFVALICLVIFLGYVIGVSLSFMD
jgi:hypothetical protein